MLGKMVPSRCLLARFASTGRVRLFQHSPRYEKSKSNDPSLPNLVTREEFTKKSAIKRSLFNRMFMYLETYGELVLSKVLPEVAMKAVKTFSSGTKMLLSDMKIFASTNNVLSATTDWKRACASLSRNDLEVYMFLPGHLMRVSPVLLVSAFPLAQNVVFPLAMMYPTRFLSPHFYTEEQKRADRLARITVRHSFYRQVLRDLQSHVKDKRIAFGSGLGAEEALALRPLFAREGPLHVGKLSALHVKRLMRLLGVRGFSAWFPRFRLQQYANLLHQIDLAVVREGGADALAPESLASSAHLRGLNVSGAERREMAEYVGTWLSVSRNLDVDTMSLLLHMPVLLGYNHRTRVWDKNSVE